MNPRSWLEQSRTKTSLEQASSPFNLVIAHDVPESAAAANEIITRFLSHSFPTLDTHQDRWNFQEMAHPEFGREALELAAQCDLFVLATLDGGELPDPIWQWIERWLQTRERKDVALVCLVGSAGGHLVCTPVQERMHQLAAAHKLAFFSSSFPALERKGAAENPATNPSRPSLKSRAPFPRPEGWGINE